MSKQNSAPLLPSGGPVKYPDDSGLKRPIDMPDSVRRGMLGVLAAACLIGGLTLFKYFDAVIIQPQQEIEAAAENAAREVELDLPKLTTLVTKKDQAAMDAVKGSGHTLYEKTPIGTNDKGGFEVVKLPSDMTLEEAMLVYEAGIGNAPAGDSVKLLNGSWTLSVDRSAGTSMRIRYADFSSGSIDAAIQNAKASQGLSEIQATDAGVDDSGNTYQEGTVKVGKKTYVWRISVVPLSDVYEVKGLPEDSFYVGIRISK